MTYTPISDHNPIPAPLSRPLAANAQIAKGQFVTVSVSTGYGQTNDGTTANQICAGIGDYSELSDTSATAGYAYARTSQRFCWGLPASTVANDGFTDADFCKPFYIAGTSTPGKLSTYGGNKRSLGGLVFGLDPIGTGTPILWASPIASLIAASSLVSNALVVANDWFALTANTTRAEASMARTAGVAGTVTSVRIAADAGFTAHDTNYWTITVSRRTAAAPGTAVVIATGTLKTTGAGGIGSLTAWKYADVPLSATAANLNVNADDVITVTCTAETTAAAIAHLDVEVIAKV